MLKSARVAICVGTETLTSCVRLGNSHLRGHRIAVNSQIMQKPVAIRRGVQEATQNRGPTCDERAPREPNVHSVWCGVGSHRRSLTNALDADLRDGEPVLNQPSSIHGVVSSILNDASTRRGYSRCMTMPSQ